MKLKNIGKAAVTGVLALALGLVGCSSGSTTDSSDAGSDTTTAEETTTTTEEGSYELVTDGVLTVATSPDYPPFENLEDGEYVGLDIELAEAVAEEMGLEVEFVSLQFDGILTAIAAGGQADVGISGITVDPERAETVDFTDSYYIDDQCIITMSSNDVITADNVSDTLNAEGMTIAVQSGTTGETYAQENFPNATVVGYGNATDCFAAMQASQADAVITNLAVGEQMISEAYTDAEIVLSIATGEEYAIAVSQDNPELTAAINEALATLEENGTIDELIAKYLG